MIPIDLIFIKAKEENVCIKRNVKVFARKICFVMNEKFMQCINLPTAKLKADYI